MTILHLYSFIFTFAILSESPVFSWISTSLLLQHDCMLHQLLTTPLSITYPFQVPLMSIHLIYRTCLSYFKMYHFPTLNYILFSVPFSHTHTLVSPFFYQFIFFHFVRCSTLILQGCLTVCWVSIFSFFSFAI